ncbi:hypothetical protein AGMMS49975_09950 [Clostridia bacterium]|nr:hypothetical protein AGMMS49975_09950 [Clostridia bacterium]
MSVWSTIDNMRTRGDIRRVYQDASNANFENRKVSVVKGMNKQQLLLTQGDDNDIYDIQTQGNVTAIDYIIGNTNMPDNIVVSGGKIEDRTKALMPFIHMLQQNNVPIIAIHCGNRHLENLINAHSGAYEIISQASLFYDAFRALPGNDIEYILSETILENEKNPKAELLIRTVVEVLLHSEGKVTFQNLSVFPVDKLMDKLNALLKQNAITSNEHADISRDYMSGSTEITTVRSFINKLNRQVSGVYGTTPKNGCNIKKLLNLNGVACVDVGANGNDLLINLALGHIKYLQGLNKEFALVIDGVDTARFPKISTLLRGRKFALSHNDFISSLFGGKEKGEDIFTQLMGDVTKLVLMRHSSGTSCKKWSEHLGTYHKIKVTMSISQSLGHTGGGLIFGGTANNANQRGIQVSETDEPRVRAETLSMLPEGVTCVHDSNGSVFIGI